MEPEVDIKCLERHSRNYDEDSLVSWAHLICLGREMEENDDEDLAEEFYRTALWVAEEYLSAEAITESLLALSAVLLRRNRKGEGATVFMRALRLFDENTNN